ncbi:MAG: IS200/IS605 family transposase [Prochloraceae cyanobacterium]|nr:IS200/IS605 family transposase [Prochloraceae cyanobacterium]
MKRYRRGRHSVTLLYTHLVFVTKYRQKIFTCEHIDYLSEVCNQVAKKMDFQVLEINGEEEHIHLLIEYPPKLSISQIVNSLKGVTSRMLRKKYNSIATMQHLWSPSYFAVSCGGAPLEKIKEYIENQRKPS